MKCFATALLSLSVAFVARAEIVDQVLASVDTEPILLSDVLIEIGPEMNEIRNRATNAAEFQQMMDARIRETLEQSIDSRILLREALLAGLEIDESRVDRRMDEIKNSYDSIQEYLEALETAGITETEWRERILKQNKAAIMASLKMNEIEEEVVISESEVAQHYYDHIDDYSQQERARCRQIFMPKTGIEQDDLVARARLDELTTELEAGADFEELAIRYSQGPAAQDGGAMGWVLKSGPGVDGDLAPALESAVFALEAGQFTDVVETEGGFHILKVDEYVESGEASLDEVRKDIVKELRRVAAQERFEKWLAELRKRSRVQIFY